MHNSTLQTAQLEIDTPGFLRIENSARLSTSAKVIDSRILEPRQCAKVILESLTHLFQLITPSGRFTYAHVKDRPDSQLDGYNLLRHCGTVWFMCTAITELRIEIASWQAQLLHNAVNYVLRRIKTPPWINSNKPCLCLITKNSIKLGGNGLALLMLRQYRNLQASRSKEFTSLSSAPDDLVEKLQNYLVSQTTGTDFVHKRRFSDGEISSFRSDYYTGEALFALFSNNTLTPELRNITISLMQSSYGVNIQSHWMAYAACEAVRHGQLDLEILASYISSLMASIVGNDDYRARQQSTPIACRSEALSVCLNTIRNHPELHRRIPAELVRAAEQCTAQNLSLQFKWYSNGQFWKGDDQDKVQIDYIQHNAASLLSWYTYTSRHGADDFSIAEVGGSRIVKDLTTTMIPGARTAGEVYPSRFISAPDFHTLNPNIFKISSDLTSQDLISEEFTRQGFQLQRFNNICRFSKDGRSAFTNGAETGFTSLLGCMIFKQKELGKQLMEMAGARIAEGRVFKRSEYEAALKYVRRTAPCIVKPVDGNLSRGLTLNVRKDNFKAAWASAKKATNSGVLIERYVRGQEARYLVVNNRCVAVSQFTPPFVIGDGKHTISQLVAMTNALRKQNPSLRDYPMELDEEKSAFLSRRGLDFSTIVAEGDQVFLSEMFDGGDTIDITEHADQGLKSVAEKITRLLPGLDIIGFDVIAIDHCAPNGGGDYAFLEGNTRPDIREHHFPAYGTVRNVAKEIVDYCVQRIREPTPRPDKLGIGHLEPKQSGLSSCQLKENVYTADMTFDPHEELAQRFSARGFSARTIGDCLLVEKAPQRVLFHYADSSFTSRIGARLLSRKHLTNMVLRDAGISVPEGRLLSRHNRAEALALVRTFGLAVIKPAAGHGGVGVSVGVTEDSFDVAWEEVLQSSDGKILVEKFFGPADEARYVVIDGQFITAVRRLPPSVVGDGLSSIEQLVELKNRKRSLNPRMRDALIELNPYRVGLLLEKGFSVNSVPAKGEQVLIDTKSGISSGGEVLTCTDSIHPGFREIAERVYDVFPDLYSVGIDILAKDHSVAPTSENYVIVEANTYPGLGGHLFPTYGEPCDLYDVMVKSSLNRLEGLQRKSTKSDVTAASTGSRRAGGSTTSTAFRSLSLESREA